MPEGVTTLEPFSLCLLNLKTLHLPLSLKNVGDGVCLQNCPDVVWYNGAPSDRDKIVFGHGNGRLLSAEWRYTSGEYSLPQSGTLGNGIAWEIGTDYCLTISGSGPIPDFDDYDMDVPWILYGALIHSLSISEGITYTGSYTLSDLQSMRSVSLPKTIEVVGECSFIGSSAITSIQLPASVQSVKGGAFAYCPSLMSFKFNAAASDLESWIFEGCTALREVELPQYITSIPDYMFMRCMSLTSIRIPNPVSEICDGAFYGSGLKEIYLPSSIKTIRVDAFYQTPLTDVYYLGTPEDRAAIDIDPAGNTALLNATWHYGPVAETNILRLPNSLRSIDDEAFAGINSDAVYIPNGCTYVGSRAFADSNVHNVHIGNQFVTFADDAFDGISDVVVVICSKGSPTADWCDSHSIQHIAP